MVARVGVGAVILLLLSAAGCRASPSVSLPRAGVPSAPSTILTPAPGVPGNAENGRALVVARGCGGCHTVPGIPGASGVIGPPLNNVALRPTLAGESIPNSPDNMTRWIMDPPSLKPGTAMPRLGLTQQEAQDVTAFLYSQPRNPLP